jgi:hypothetical protein
MRSKLHIVALTVASLLIGLQAAAVPTTVVGVDHPRCDVLSVPTFVDELGNPPTPPVMVPPSATGPFPVGEQIASQAIGPTAPNYVPCPGNTDSNAFPNQRVTITNLNAIAFTDLWYVANLQTNVANYDGLINGALAFKIDSVGLNIPLISESILADGIFAPGETWIFVIADYLNNSAFPNPTPPPNLFGAIGVPSAGTNGAGSHDGSTGSIIGLPVPEPGTGLLVIAGLLGLAGYRKRA